LSIARYALAALIALAPFALASRAAAQRQTIEPEVRVDGIISNAGVLQAAVGADIPISAAMHLELAAGAGPTFANGARVDLSARTDAVVHFLLDPQHSMKWSPYAGGGIGARYNGANWRGVAIVVVGVNAPKWKNAIPFVEAGLGGGFRIGAGLRRAR
jgi:hypothetical protein